MIKAAPETFVPIMRARAHFVSEELAQRALIAADRFAHSGKPFCTPRDLWRFETLTVPSNPPREIWKDRNSSPAPDIQDLIEADWQSTFYESSLQLFNRLRENELAAFGRCGNIVGEWISIPIAAWQLLRFQFDPTLENWRLGHACGAGLDLWDIRLLDYKGLSLARAAIAYGAPKDAAIVQRHLAHNPKAALPRTAVGSIASRLNREMTEIPYPGPARSTASAFTAAEAALRSSVIEKLASGTLLGFGIRFDGQRVPIASADWNRSRPDFTESALQTHAVRFSDILVRQPNPSGERLEKQQPPHRSLDDLDLWWRQRQLDNPDGLWPFDEPADVSAAQAEFGNVNRDTIRSLRKQLGTRARPRGRPKSANTPPKSATQI